MEQNEFPKTKKNHQKTPKRIKHNKAVDTAKVHENFREIISLNTFTVSTRSDNIFARRREVVVVSILYFTYKRVKDLL